MKLQFKCKRCGEILGYYEGKDFFIVSENGAWYSLIQPKVTVLCSGCWNQTKSKSHDSAVTYKKRKQKNE